VGDAPEIPSQASIVAEFSGQKASYWGEHAPASISRFTPVGRARQVALTFDACGGHALDYDSELIETLRRHRVSATLFINLRWAQAHPKTVSELAADPLFEVANHGHRHVPLSVSPRFAWGIPSTEDVGEVWSEIAENTQYLRQIGLEPAFMRPGTAYADDISAQIAVRLGTPIVSYSLNADGGATFTSAEVDAALSGVQPGDIVIGHFNRPGSGTAAGFSAALPRLLKRGFFFVQLSDAVNSA
jgi:peptidoglycan/xylan/chitin deacetylase (PgdA/CDA1 family)